MEDSSQQSFILTENNRRHDDGRRHSSSRRLLLNDSSSHGEYASSSMRSVVMDDISRNGYAVSSRRSRPTYATQQSFQTKKKSVVACFCRRRPRLYLGVILVGIWLIMVPLAWNMSHLLSQYENHQQEVVIDVPSARTLKRDNGISSIEPSTRTKVESNFQIQVPLHQQMKMTTRLSKVSVSKLADGETMSIYSDDEVYANVWKTLTDVIPILEAANVDYFLMAGTLLGFARSKKSSRPWMDTRIDLAVSISWLQTLDNSERLKQTLNDGGFVWSKSHIGVDGTSNSLGGAQIYTKYGVKVEVVATDVRRNVHMNGFRYQQYRVGCPKPFFGIESLTWGTTTLKVRVPKELEAILEITYGEEYMNHSMATKDFRMSRIDYVTSTGKCMIIKDQEQVMKERSQDFQRGLLTIVSSDETTAQVLVLAKKLNEWNNRGQPVALEVHHSGELSYYLEAQLTLYPFVTVVNLRTMSSFPSKKLNYTDANLAVQALHTTKLRHVLWITPSINFLYHPSYILQTAEYVHNHNPKCTIMTDNFSCVTAIDQKQPELLKDALHSSESFSIIRIHPFRELVRQVYLNQTALVVATVHEAIDGIGFWMHPTDHFSRWATTDILEYPLSLVLDKHEPSVPIDTEWQQELLSYWKYYQEARRIMLLDRNIAWVPSDGSYFFEYSILNSKKGIHEAHARHTSIVNVNLVLSKDKVLIASNSEHFFTPYEFPGNQLPNSVALMEGNDLKELTNPCVPEEVARKWLLDNPYIHYNCSHELIQDLNDFLLYSIDAEVCYDLKASSSDTQIEQAKTIVETFGHFDDVLVGQGKVSVRFHDATNGTVSTSSVIPEYGLKALSMEKSLAEMGFYVNVPSRMACSQFINWIRNHNFLRNKNILGCYVDMNNALLVKNWDSFIANNGVQLDVLGMPTSPSKPSFPTLKAICDLPKKPSSPNQTFWKRSHIACVEEGYEEIVHPWSIPMNADFFTLSSGMEETLPSIQNYLFYTILPKHLPSTTKPFHWSLSHLSDWSNRRNQWFQGNTALSKGPTENDETFSFPGITKLLIHILLLRLEDLGLVNLDELVPLQTETDVSTTKHSWRHFLCSENVLQSYSNSVVEESLFNYIQQSCGVNFTTAMHYHVLEPMGLLGSFNLTTANNLKGYVGAIDDPILIASTLVSAGVSPKTRRQVLSAASVNYMLRPTVANDKSAGNAHEHRLLQSISRHLSSNQTKQDSNAAGEMVVDGYGLGVWCVNGLRRTHQGQPIRGWLSLDQGNILGSQTSSYWDVTGLVLSVYAPSPGLEGDEFELATTFAAVVRMIGDHILQTVLPKK